MVDQNIIAQSIAVLTERLAVLRLSQFVPDWRQNPLLCLLLALAIGFAIGRYRAYRNVRFQNDGEALLSRAILKHFGPPDYHLMNHISLQMKDGTTQIDQIIVSRFGVFVIETKNYKGWIFANPNQADWTQVMFKAKFKFQNPIRQNFRHVSAVQDLLDFLPPGAVKSAVVFTGEAEFKTEIPQGVFDGISGFISYLRGQTVAVMSMIEFNSVWGGSKPLVLPSAARLMSNTYRVLHDDMATPSSANVWYPTLKVCFRGNCLTPTGWKRSDAALQSCRSKHRFNVGIELPGAAWRLG